MTNERGGDKNGNGTRTDKKERKSSSLGGAVSKIDGGRTEEPFNRALERRRDENCDPCSPTNGILARFAMCVWLLYVLACFATIYLIQYNTNIERVY